MPQFTPVPVPLSIWTDLLDPGEPAWTKILRTVAVYLALLLLLRAGGKRELGQRSAIDLAVLLLLANTVQNAIIGDDLSLTGGIIGAGMLILLDNALSWAAYRFHWVDRLISGRPEPLIRDGHVLPANLRRQRISTEDLTAIFRMQGVDHLDDVDAAILETNGTVSIQRRERAPQASPTRDQASQILARLAAIEARLDTLGRPGQPTDAVNPSAPPPARR